MIASLYAGILALIFVALSVWVVMGRWHKASFGDAGNDDMMRRVRIHGNFAEYVPLALLLLVLYETQAGSFYLVHVFGIALVVARIAHIYALKSDFFPARAFGVSLTFLTIAVMAILLVFKGITATQVL